MFWENFVCSEKLLGYFYWPIIFWVGGLGTDSKTWLEPFEELLKVILVLYNSGLIFRHTKRLGTYLFRINAKKMVREIKGKIVRKSDKKVSFLLRKWVKFWIYHHFYILS